MTSLIKNIFLGLALATTLQAGHAFAATPTKTAVAAQPASDRDMIAEIISVIGLKPRFEVMAAEEVGNAAAVILNGKRYILYNPEFLAAVNNAVHTDWAGVSILAHEIGHHLNGHTLSSRGSSHADELEADEFSGFVLRKMGASLADAQAAIGVLADEEGSETHPGRTARLSHISKGWQQANAQLLAANKANKKAPAIANITLPETQVVAARTAAKPTQISSEYVLGRVVFDKAPQNSYLITRRLNVVQELQKGIKVVGKISETNSAQFPFVITSDIYSSLLISETGIIVDQKGRRVGKLQQA